MIIFILMIQSLMFLFYNQGVDYKYSCYISSVEVLDHMIMIDYNSYIRGCDKKQFKLYDNDSLQYFKYKKLDVYLDVYEELDLEILEMNSKLLRPYFDNKIKEPGSPPVKTPFAFLYFIVDSNGKIIEKGGELDIETKSESGIYDKEIVDILNDINVDIHPGILNGKPVASLCRIPLDLNDIKYIEP